VLAIVWYAKQLLHNYHWKKVHVEWISTAIFFQEERTYVVQIFQRRDCTTPIPCCLSPDCLGHLTHRKNKGLFTHYYRREQLKINYTISYFGHIVCHCSTNSCIVDISVIGNALLLIHFIVQIIMIYEVYLLKFWCCLQTRQLRTT